MTKFRFEISNCIDVEVDAVDKEEARSKVIYRLEKGDYDKDMGGTSSIVSDGIQIKN